MFVEKGSTSHCRSILAVHAEGDALPQFLIAIQTFQHTDPGRALIRGRLCNELVKRIQQMFLDDAHLHHLLSDEENL